MNDRDLLRTLRAPAPDEPASLRPLALPAVDLGDAPPDAAGELVAVRPRRIVRPRVIGLRTAAIGIVVVLGLVIASPWLPFGGPQGPAGPGASPTPTLPPGVTVTREQAVDVVCKNAQCSQVLDVRLGEIGAYAPDQRVVPANRLVWAVTLGAGNTSTDFVDAHTGEWLMGMSPAPDVILADLQSAGLPVASAETGPRRVTVGSLIVEVPAGWSYYPMSMTSSFTSVNGVLANFDLAKVCGLPSMGMACLQHLVLADGWATIYVGTAAFPGWTIESMKPAAGWTTYIDGMPAVLEVNTDAAVIPAGAVQGRKWQIARQDSEDNRDTVDAYLAADPSGQEGLLAEVADAIVKGITHVTPITPLPTGAAGEEAAAAAVITALGRLDADARAFQGSTFYGCFPTVAGGRRAVTLTDGPSGRLAAPLSAECRTDLQVSDNQAWHLVLEVGPPVGAGSTGGTSPWLTFSALLAQDGSIMSTTSTGQLPGSP